MYKKSISKNSLQNAEIFKKLIRSLHQTKNTDKRKSIAKELICLAKNYANRAQIVNASTIFTSYKRFTVCMI